jgi:hypothetical protein
MEEITRNIRRSIEESNRNAQEDSRTRESDKSNRIDIENRLIEEYAKKHNLWLPINDVFKMGGAFPSGNENDVFFSENEQVIYKVNNLLNNKGSVLSLLDRLCAFNRIFPETQYEIFGFSGFGNGNVYPVLKQQYVNSATEALDDEIELFMRSIGFRKNGNGSFENGIYEVSDLFPRNVLKDKNGVLYVVDANVNTISIP